MGLREPVQEIVLDVMGEREREREREKGIWDKGIG